MQPDHRPHRHRAEHRRRLASSAGAETATPRLHQGCPPPHAPARQACVIPGANKSALFTKQTHRGQSAYCAAMLKRTGRHRGEVVDMRMSERRRRRAPLLAPRSLIDFVKDGKIAKRTTPKNMGKIIALYTGLYGPPDEASRPHAARDARASSSPAATSAARMRSISAAPSLTSGGRTVARGICPSSTRASFMRLCMSTNGSA
jgi:hypothetical protein